MSGRKKGFVGVDRTVLEQIRRRAAERSKQIPPKSQLDDSGLAVMKTEMDKSQERQALLEASMADCSSDLQTLETQVSGQIRSLQQELVNQMVSVGADIQMVFQGVSTQLHDLQCDLETTQAEMAHLGEVVQGIEAREDALFSEADRWLDGATKLLEFIDAVYAHETLAPGAALDLGARLSRAELAYQRGAPEAAYVLAEGVYFDLSKLRIYLETSFTRWLAFHHAARTQAAELHRMAVASREVKACDLEGNELDIMVNADYWSGRHLGRQTSRIARLAEELTHSTTEMLDPVWLEELVLETLPRMQAELDQTLTQARLAALEAQLRANIAERVIEALEGQGYNMAGENLPEDIRDGCRVKLLSLDGSFVEVRVAGIPGRTGQNELSLLSEEGGRWSPHELERRASEVVHALSGTGLVVEQLRPEKTDRQEPIPKPQVMTELKIHQSGGAQLLGDEIDHVSNP